MQILPTFKIISYGSSDYQASVALREEVLRKPLGLTFLAEELEKEKNHIHMAGLQGQAVVATAVLVPEGSICKMQRVVVKPALQGRGIGSHLLQFFENYAKDQGFQAVYCHARDSAVHFYLKNYYIQEGGYFEEDTVPHLKLGKSLK